MFKNIAVAYDESPEACRALTAAIHLAKTLGAGLESVTVMEKLPAYTAFATSADPAMLSTLEEDRASYYGQLQEKARAAALREGVQLSAFLVDGEAIDGIVNFVCAHKIDLLVIGLHRRHDRLSRLWSTVYTIAQNVPCSVFGVH
ncbi:MAG: universal stress protein [Terracidiphilus sp.]|jgi:nucleotide-binding universal stress UspA family protein